MGRLRFGHKNLNTPALGIPLANCGGPDFGTTSIALDFFGLHWDPWASAIFVDRQL